MHVSPLLYGTRFVIVAVCKLSWRSTTAGEDGLPYVHGGAGRESRDKENVSGRPSVLVTGAGGDGNGAKLNVGDGKSIIIRIETAPHSLQ
jgi:hypothetical protein